MANLAVIPARGGSKRIPKKNIKRFGGHPLITWTISAAQESGLFDRIIVTTDNYEIGRVAGLYEAEVYYRDKALADDNTPAYMATVDVVESVGISASAHWQRYDYDTVAQLLPTCPLRTAKDIRESYQHFSESKPDVQISVADYGWQNPWWSAIPGKSDFRFMEKRSQDLPEVYCPTGAVWWADTDYLLKRKTFYTKDTEFWIMDRMRAIDIDTMDDWEVADAFRRARGNVW